MELPLFLQFFEKLASSFPHSNTPKIYQEINKKIPFRTITRKLMGTITGLVRIQSSNLCEQMGLKVNNYERILFREDFKYHQVFK